MGRVLALIIIAGCAPVTQTHTAHKPVHSTASPTVEVSGLRTGQALHVQVVASAPSRLAGSSFERPQQWTVEARADGMPLDRLVNGSTRVTRLQVHTTNRWDVTVAFDAAFRLPQELTSSEVWVAPPGAQPQRFLIAGL